ncbi:hypothetical protein [uncultured Phocaeicola sp.]|uniref:hypothetical protein n=1 Tax=uncultured Phocaeicola sp. TaxID=990718 RepID=UPI0025DCDCC0|nr:hypothetical protein [uncultured Phocaeicola sp.]
MKEMENNDFVHTLDAVYNLCSEIKEHITSIETTDEEENNEGLILLSDNLQRLQAEIAGMKSQLSAGRKVVLLGIILLLLVGNACQFKRNMQLSDNDLKYRLIKMYGGISGNELDTLEVVFHRDRNKTVIRNIRNEVEDFEYRTRVRAEKLEKARLLQQEAENI